MGFSVCYPLISLIIHLFFIPQPLRAVGVLFSPMVYGWPGRRAAGGKFVRAVSQKP